MSKTSPASPKKAASSPVDPIVTDETTSADERSSRDERHLATYPVALLSFQAKQGKTIVQTRETRHPISKKPITSTWRVMGSDALGLPTPSDEAVLMVLMEISREQGFPQEVTFTQLDVLQRLGWDKSQSSYKKLVLAFERLTSVTISSQNVFWDATNKAFVQTAFHLLEEFEIVATPGRYRKAKTNIGEEAKASQTGKGADKSQGKDAGKDTGKGAAMSRFVWGTPLWRSFKDGNLKPISLSFYFELSLPLARRLFRFLDLVKFDGKPVYRIGLRKLCEQFLAVSEAKYLSVYKNTLRPAHDELIAQGFLREVRYEANKAGDGENVIYTFMSKAEASPMLRDEIPEMQLLLPIPQAAEIPTLRAATRAAAELPPSELTPQRAAHFKSVFDAMDKAAQNELLGRAKAKAPDFTWPHLQDPERAISWALWELVEEHSTR